jgi:hypothetical protein
MGKYGGTSQTDEMDWEAMDDEEFSLSQTRQEGGGGQKNRILNSS